jgi:hypothetical protein
MSRKQVQQFPPAATGELEQVDLPRRPGEFESVKTERPQRRDGGSQVGIGHSSGDGKRV